ncbi:MAG TPA: sugar transferase [Methylomirabilota bacterium]|nr:sugar transferase [Methylomirabilota bacterium]
MAPPTIMSTAQRFAWLDGLSTVAVCGAAIAVVPPADPAELPAGPWGLAGRIAVVAFVCLVAFYYNDLYNFEVPHDVGQLFRRLCRALGLSALALAGGYLLFPGMVLGGNLASTALLLTLVSVLALRVGVYALAKRAPFSERVLILGGGPLAAELAGHIRTRPELPLRLVGVLGPSAGSGTPRLGDYGDLADALRRYRPDRIVVAMPDRRGNLPVADLLACRFRRIEVEEGTRVFERLTGRLAVESLAPSALIFGDGFRGRRLPLVLMRVLSVGIALATLVVGAPLIAAIVLAVRLESRGPAFFIQERVGLHGRRFRLVKFRTMRESAGDADSVWGRDNASRVTRLGALLRRYRLDELPQCFNILRGDMNLVGPRPEMAANVATFEGVIPFYNLRHEVRPGLTGWAQVKAGYSMSTEEVTRKLCYDLYYIKHMSPAFDLRILVDTVKFVLSGTRPG